ncbi:MULTISPECIES: GFA family protein [unclassified Mesorhizobium]|uniref:GFA family protein n=1 Tax=unclassified Mesorhizobium TaxID=325217 RepID=UPI0007FE2FCC|nr:MULTISPECIES: GFA family protein [unclassified Mesorhizobium]WIE93277.1 GFA family protein [Mesorhizobium sp. WSM4875]MDG4851191.1 GFA family protein [Mesorhizobium sp. WSM4982]MDG4912469.1 GFA family protein [Mesorhizobium sp. WSM4983]OBQ97096.1 aldehyde-activating protein [Mesorhizobium sp. AA23]PBB90022.1 aldehyde-activating protein [Mesorhizobium sp. WSM3864]
MLYKGSCHCGKVAFEVAGELGGAVRCNCSICARKGALLWAVPHASMRLVAWGDDLGKYTFGKGLIAHRFCRTCGIHPFAEDVSQGSERSAYININCLDGIDHAAIEVFEFDGRSA